MTEECLVLQPAKAGALRGQQQGSALLYYSHICWRSVLGLPQGRSGDEYFDLGKTVLIQKVSVLPLCFIKQE